jgi:hypothetical protein
MVAKHFENSEWGFLNENTKKEIRIKLSNGKMFYIRIL